MSLPIQPLPFREEIETLFKRIAVLQKELNEKTDRLHFLYGFEMKSAPYTPAPVDDDNDNEEAENDKDGDENEDEQEVEGKKTGVKNSALKTSVKKSAVKKTVIKKGGSEKKRPRRCKQCKEHYLEDNAASNLVNCKKCRDENTKMWNEGRANRERKRKERDAKKATGR